MPDPNKFHMLDAIGWDERPVCGLCMHFAGRPGEFGRCSDIRYEHNKHGLKQLGVHAYGGCDDFERDAARAKKMLQTYSQESRTET